MTTWIKTLFFIAALYDGLLGVTFLFFAPAIFRSFGVTPPNHFGYVYFPALLLIIFAVMFLQISRDPVGNHGLILYGIGLKASYSGVVFWYQLHGGLPSLWLPFAWADLLFLVLFAAAWRRTERA